MNLLAERIRELKTDCGCSVRQLADATGIKRSNMGDYISGKTPIPSELLLTLADAFGCNVRYLLMLPGSPLPKRKCAKRGVSNGVCLRHQPMLRL